METDHSDVKPIEWMGIAQTAFDRIQGEDLVARTITYLAIGGFPIASLDRHFHNICRIHAKECIEDLTDSLSTIPEQGIWPLLRQAVKQRLYNIVNDEVDDAILWACMSTVSIKLGLTNDAQIATARCYMSARQFSA
jgi:hypothetical protein